MTIQPIVEGHGNAAAAAHRRCRSFRKLTSSFGALLRAMGHEVTPWPPAAWTVEG